MLNEKRVITMSKMAMYSKGKKKQSIQVTSFYKVDYIIFQTIMAILWATVGYLILVCGYMFLHMDAIIADLSFDLMKEMVIYILTAYAVFILAFGTVSAIFYEWKYSNALKISKKYYQSLGVLNAVYKKEKQNERNL